MIRFRILTPSFRQQVSISSLFSRAEIKYINYLIVFEINTALFNQFLNKKAILRIKKLIIIFGKKWV